MTNTQTNTETIFVNLFAAITAEKTEQLKKFIEDINDKKELSDLSGWYYKDLLPKGKNVSKFDFETLKSYLIDRKTKATDKAIAKELNRLQTVEKAADLVSIVVSIEWKKSRMWGNNPNASAKIHTSNNWENYDSGSIGGCGYDKESTAVANCINQSNSFLKAMYLVKEQYPEAVNRELFGYGSGYGILPRLEGGVGVSCYPRIFEKIGFKFNHTASGKTFDVYSIEK